LKEGVKTSAFGVNAATVTARGDDGFQIGGLK
jgi:hypothetical protein